MKKSGSVVRSPPQDIYEFSLGDEETKVMLGSGSVGRASPLTEYIQAEHHQGGLFTLPPPTLHSNPGGLTGAAASGTHKKKRKRCGVCGPCLRKENCGNCTNCFNRKVGHQICKLRKCEQLKKKLSTWEVGFEDNSKAWFTDSNLAAKIDSGVGAVDGRRDRGQMETGSHDCLEDGVLSLGLTNGTCRRPDEEDEDPGRDGHVEAVCSIPRQIWGSGQENTDNPQPSLQQPFYVPGCKASLDDAKNLIAFSTSIGSLPLAGHHEQQVPTAQLYEKFNQEMVSEGAETGGVREATGRECDLTEDLSTLQTALSQARHGNKPPNCNCDGPDCPDYLEWLEKKIKLASDDQSKKHCEVASSPKTHPSQPAHHLNGAHIPLRLSASESQPQAPQIPLPSHTPCTLAPIPCSPSVLSIAKEKNISLQTALAIEALTELSVTVHQTEFPRSEMSTTNSLQPARPTPHPSQAQNGAQLDSCSSPLLQQSVVTGLYTHQEVQNWDQKRKQSQLEASTPHLQHSSPRPCSVSPYSRPTSASGSPMPQQWGSCEKNIARNVWMAQNSQPQFPPRSHHGTRDPMSELKQLLGEPPFRFPTPQSHPNRGVGPGLIQIKQEMDNGDYPCAATMGNGQPPFSGRPLSPGSATIRHATQAALQQHLHHKRNLFSTLPTPPHRMPVGFQDLRKWWPQPGLECHIKQEPKEPKKKSVQASPSPRHCGPLGSPFPKPKQIVIKKSKQKASQPLFLPQKQISMQKVMSSSQDNNSVLPHIAMDLGTIPALVPAHSQESILNSALAPIAHPHNAQGTPTPITTVSSAAPLPTSNLRPGYLVEGNSAKSTMVENPGTKSESSLRGFNSLNPKLEELIRQFEAEFEDSSSVTPLPAPQTHAAESVKDPSDAVEPSSNSGQAMLVAHPPAVGSLSPGLSAVAPPANEVMDVEDKAIKSGMMSCPSQTPDSGEMEQQCDGVTGNSNCMSDQALPPAQEALLQVHQHRVLEDPFTMPFSPLPKRFKVESSGGVTVLSTTTCFQTSLEGETPTKAEPLSEPSLRGFLESPLRYLDTPTKSLLDTPAKVSQAEFPLCDCVEQIVEKDEGPYYNHLGSGPTVASIRELMESRSGEKGEAIRIEKVIYTGKEGKSSQGCPIAKWVIRRSSEAEKLLCLVRHRAGHHCANAVIIILIMAWEGVPRELGNKLYNELTDTLPKYGNPTSRRCGLNEDRTCACQGKDIETCGASFSFGCSWSMYFNGCKYARSKMPRKFRLQGDHPKEEENLRDNFQDLATRVAPLYKKLAPKAYSNQCSLEETAKECRLGLKEGRPFSGVTACMDFCAHAHKDQHNLYNGCTVVCTLTKEDNRMVGQIPDDEQLHVLPLYKVSLADEFGSEENQRLKMQNGSIQVLSNFRREVRKLPEPAKSCRQRRLEAKKAASEKKKGQKQQAGETPEKTIKTEFRHSSLVQQGDKAVPKQEVKPTIKMESKGHFPSVNGVLEGYPGLGNHQSSKPYGVNNIYSHPGYYASGHSSTSQSPAASPSPVNGVYPNIHSNAMHYGYYNYSSNALFSQKASGYQSHNGTWSKGVANSCSFDKNPDVQSLQATLARTFSHHTEQLPADATKRGLTIPVDLSQPLATPTRPPTAPSDLSQRATPVIKQEPVDVPLYSGCTTDRTSQGCSTNYTPGSESWPSQKPNGSLASNSWDHMKAVSQEAFSSEKHVLHQQRLLQTLHRHQPPQPNTEQWSTFPGTNTPMASPAPSPTLKVAPSPTHLPSPRHWESPSPGLQSKSWSMVPPTYNMGLKHANAAGAFPDKIWSKAGENRSSTPLGLQEKAWKSCGGSVAGSTPSPAPEGRLFPDAFQQLDMQTCQEPAGVNSEGVRTVEREPEEEEVWSDSEHNFLDPNIGGVAVAPAHGSILIECARRELHATTPLKKPDRRHPTRISLVFYQHKNLNQPCHGLALWEAKMKLLAERALQRQQEAALLGLSQDDIKVYGKKRKWGAMTAAGGVSPGPGQAKDKREGVITRQALSQHSTSIVTVSPYAFTQLTGPYSRWV